MVLPIFLLCFGLFVCFLLPGGGRVGWLGGVDI